MSSTKRHTHSIKGYFVFCSPIPLCNALTFNTRCLETKDSRFFCKTPNEMQLIWGAKSRANNFLHKQEGQWFRGYFPSHSTRHFRLDWTHYCNSVRTKLGLGDRAVGNTDQATNFSRKGYSLNMHAHSSVCGPQHAHNRKRSANKKSITTLFMQQKIEVVTKYR